MSARPVGNRRSFAPRPPTKDPICRMFLRERRDSNPRPPGDRPAFRLIPARDLRGMKRSRRSLCQIHLLICRASTGSDGTRTRDLRRDRPVLVVPVYGGDRRGLPGRAGLSNRRLAGVWREPAGASSNLLRDENGMLRCLSRKRPGPARDALGGSRRGRRRLTASSVSTLAHAAIPRARLYSIESRSAMRSSRSSVARHGGRGRGLR